MTEVLLFHHAQGLTPGVRAFADDLRAGGDIVHTPDLFDRRIFPSIEEGLAYIEKSGLDDLRMRGVRIADDLLLELVYAGFSFVLPAQQLAQARPKARGALSSIPVSRLAASGRLDHGRTAFRCKSTAWIMTRFS